LAKPEFHIRPLFDRFNIEILSTTDAPDADLASHAKLAADGWGERVVPTFRPDAMFYPDRAGWAADVRSLSAASGIEIVDYDGFLAALRQRIRLRGHHALRDRADVARRRTRDAGAPRRAARPLRRRALSVRAQRRIRHPRGRGVHPLASAPARRLRA